MSNGTCKALHSLKHGADIIDGCILGYGRGSGNAKTELIMMDLNKNYNKKNIDTGNFKCIFR
jgi:isopropylmalate/homocitrate/citramalate synthase